MTSKKFLLAWRQDGDQGNLSQNAKKLKFFRKIDKTPRRGSLISQDWKNIITPGLFYTTQICYGHILSNLQKFSFTRWKDISDTSLPQEYPVGTKILD